MTDGNGSHSEQTLRGRTILMSGGSRGTGLAIALRAARDGANVALLSKTSDPNPRLPGTIHTAVAAIEATGGQAHGVVGDVRDVACVEHAVAAAVERFGGIDVVVNNASAIDLSPSTRLATNRFDLMQRSEVRGTSLLTRTAVPHLRRSDHAHVLTLSSPLNIDPRWLGSDVGYVLAKYGVTLCALRFAEEFRGDAIASNTLWPRTTIATAAVQNLFGGDAAIARWRRPEIMADAAHAIIARRPMERTGATLLDEEVLAEIGVTDLTQYAYPGTDELTMDIFVDPLRQTV
jgi:citronellol/citronellal dehydrogenase